MSNPSAIPPPPPPPPEPTVAELDEIIDSANPNTPKKGEDLIDHLEDGTEKLLPATEARVVALRAKYPVLHYWQIRDSIAERVLERAENDEADRALRYPDEQP